MKKLFSIIAATLFATTMFATDVTVDLSKGTFASSVITWTVADEDHDGLYSFKAWFLKFRNDPTETRFVDECFEGDFKHWEAFKNSKYIKPIYENIKKEANQRNLADVMGKIMDTAMDDNNKSQMVALKYLVDKYSKEAGEPSAGRGRPKKADIEKAAKEIAEEDKALAEDLKRIS